MDKINLKLIKKQNNYYLTLCNPVIVDLINDCPNETLAIRIPKNFKKWNTIFSVHNNIKFIYKNLNNISFNDKTRIIELNDSCFLIYLETSKDIKKNSLCITKIEIPIIPTCLDNKYLNDNISLDEFSKLVCKTRDNCCELRFLDNNNGIKGDQVRIVKENDIVGVKLLNKKVKWEWAARAGNTSNNNNIDDKGLGIITDKDGNIYVTGVITNTDDSTDEINFYNSNETTPNNELSFENNDHMKEIFVAKIDINGKWEWVARAGGIRNDIGNDISVDLNGNIFVTGLINNKKNELKFYDAKNTESNNSSSFGLIGNGGKIFVAKIDSNGKWKWVVSANGNGDSGLSIDTGPYGNIYVTGRITANNKNNLINFYDKNGISSNISLDISNNGQEIFVAKINSIGEWKWVARGGNDNSDNKQYSDRGFGISVCTDNSIYITGVITNSDSINEVNFYDNGETIENNISFGLSGGANEIIVAKLNDNGEWVWVARAGNTSDNNNNNPLEKGTSIITDKDGNIYVTGVITNTNDSTDEINFYNSNETTPNNELSFKNNDHKKEIFVAKIDINGKWEWVARAGGIQYDIGNDISVDLNGNIFVTGLINNNKLNFYNAMNIQPNDELSFGLNGNGGEIFVAKIDRNGEWVWVVSAGGNGDSGLSIDTGPYGDIYVTGRITANDDNDPINFYDENGISSNISLDISNNGREIFVAKINDKYAPIIGILDSDAQTNDKPYICFPNNNIEIYNKLNSGQNYYIDKDGNITTDYICNTYYGTAISNKKLIIYNENK